MDALQETKDERDSRMQRDMLREERRRERERERRLAEKEGGAISKKSKLTRDRDRDIGEKIALGQVLSALKRKDVPLLSRKYPIDLHMLAFKTISELL